MSALQNPDTEPKIVQMQHHVRVVDGPTLLERRLAKIFDDGERVEATIVRTIDDQEIVTEVETMGSNEVVVERKTELSAADRKAFRKEWAHHWRQETRRIKTPAMEMVLNLDASFTTTMRTGSSTVSRSDASVLSLINESFEKLKSSVDPRVEVQKKSRLVFKQRSGLTDFTSKKKITKTDEGNTDSEDKSCVCKKLGILDEKQPCLYKMCDKLCVKMGAAKIKKEDEIKSEKRSSYTTNWKSASEGEGKGQWTTHHAIKSKPSKSAKIKSEKRSSSRDWKDWKTCKENSQTQTTAYETASEGEDQWKNRTIKREKSGSEEKAFKSTIKRAPNSSEQKNFKRMHEKLIQQLEQTLK